MIHVRGQVKGSKIVKYLKTDAAYRDIDLCPEVVALLAEYIGDRTSGLFFPSETGITPMSYSNYGRKPISHSLHPARLGEIRRGGSRLSRLQYSFKKTHEYRGMVGFETNCMDEHDPERVAF